MLIADLGLALVLVALAMLTIWRLADLFEKKGRWSEELDETGFDQEPDDETDISKGVKS